MSSVTLFPHKIVADVVVWSLAPIIAYLFRFDGFIPAEALPGLAWYAGIGLVLKGVAVIAFRLNVQSWKHASFRDTVVIGRAVVAVGIAEVAVGLAIHSVLPLPRSVLPLSIVLGALLLFGVRALRRVLHARSRRYGNGAPFDGSRRVVIVGAGEGGHLVVREMLRHPQAGLMPIAVVDDDRAKHGLAIDGVPVVGPIDRLPAVLRDRAGDEVVVAIASADGALIRRVRALSNEVAPAMPVRVIPGVYEVLAGDVTVSRLRDVQIEDLLRRPRYRSTCLPFASTSTATPCSSRAPAARSAPRSSASSPAARRSASCWSAAARTASTSSSGSWSASGSGCRRSP